MKSALTAAALLAYLGWFSVWAYPRPEDVLAGVRRADADYRQPLTRVIWVRHEPNALGGGWKAWDAPPSGRSICVPYRPKPADLY